jgi:flavin reductase (DIM6/NTAB) family NADH-FMN oxidoreductase RutF
MPPKLFELPTEAVDNFVGNRFLKGLSNGFHCSFVTLMSFKPEIIIISISIS